MSLCFRYQKNFIFDVNPLVKFFLFISYFFLIFAFTNPYYLIVIFINMTIIAVSGKDVQKIFKFIKYVLFWAFSVFIVNIIIRNDGATDILKLPLKFPIYGVIKITLETVVFSFIMIFQLILVMFLFALINILINPDDLMKVFMKLKMPYLILFISTISLRFFPVLLEDLENIKDTMLTRGIELDKGKWLTRIKKKIALILPLLTNSLERSIQVAEALESRAFGISKERTFFKQITLNFGDYEIIILNFIFLGILLYLRYYLHYGVYDAFPRYENPSLTLSDIYILSFLFVGNIFFLVILFVRWKLT
ncbi:MAG: energy-coupling factor transporter transmembrane component T family protein [Promethearchaeia archaeon]